MIKQFFFLTVLIFLSSNLFAQGQQHFTEVPTDYFDSLPDTIHPIKLQREEYWYGRQSITCDTTNEFGRIKRFIDPLKKTTFCAYYDEYNGGYTIIKTTNAKDTTGNSAVIWQIGPFDSSIMEADSIKLIKMGKADILYVVWKNYSDNSGASGFGSSSSIQKTIIDITKELILFHGDVFYINEGSSHGNSSSEECERHLNLQGTSIFLSTLDCKSSKFYHDWNDSLNVYIDHLETIEKKDYKPKQYIYKNQILISVSDK